MLVVTQTNYDLVTQIIIRIPKGVQVGLILFIYRRHQAKAGMEQALKHAAGVTKGWDGTGNHDSK